MICPMSANVQYYPVRDTWGRGWYVRIPVPVPVYTKVLGMIKRFNVKNTQTVDTNTYIFIYFNDKIWSSVYCGPP